jgi:ABC-type sugar transport system permease subunit
MSTVITVLVAYYLGGITTLLLNEVDDGDGIQVADVFAVVAWPVSAAALIVKKIQEYQKGT